jgi:hypothetical protein
MMSDPSGLDAKYPSNSFTNRPAPKEAKPAKVVEAVTKNEVVVQKRSLGKRFAEVFIGADARSVWQYIAYDVLVPAAKDMVSDAVSSGVERMLFGESSSRSRGRGFGQQTGKGGFTNYSKASQGGRPGMSSRGRARHDFKELVMQTRPEAEEVLSSMYRLLETYNVVTVNDFYGICDVTGSFADEKYGWTDLRGSHVIRVRNGYIVDLPAPEVLD